MNVDIKVQVEALKTGTFSVAEHKDVVMVTQGHYIVYIKKDRFFLNIEKIKKFKGCISYYYPEEMEKHEYTATETNKLLRMNNGEIVVGIETEGNHEMIWIKEKYLRLFKGCAVSAYVAGDKNTGIIFRGGKMIKGLVLPVQIRKGSK